VNNDKKSLVQHNFSVGEEAPPSILSTSLVCALACGIGFGKVQHEWFNMARLGDNLGPRPNGARMASYFILLVDDVGLIMLMVMHKSSPA
jgi:hypothetical protein